MMSDKIGPQHLRRKAMLYVLHNLCRGVSPISKKICIYRTLI